MPAAWLNAALVGANTAVLTAAEGVHQVTVIGPTAAVNSGLSGYDIPALRPAQWDGCRPAQLGPRTPAAAGGTATEPGHAAKLLPQLCFYSAPITSRRRLVPSRLPDMIFRAVRWIFIR